MLAVALAGAGLLVLPQVAVAASARVALLPIVVHSADAEPSYLRGGLAEMLSARLEQSGQISVIRVETGERSTTRLPVAVRAARSTGADFVLFGSFTQFGDGASLDIRCASLDAQQGSAGPPTRRIFIHSGTVTEIIPKLDNLAEKVSLYVLGVSEPAAGPLPMDSPDPATAPTGVDSYQDLLRRVDALESAVYSGALGRGAEEGPSASGEGEGEGQGADPEPPEASSSDSPLR